MSPTSTFHLRPVNATRSASPSTSTSTASERSPTVAVGPTSPSTRLPPPTSASATRPRRPFSPSSLRDVDLPLNRDAMGPRKYPAPPTGHELMALFPPKPPVNLPPGPTSGYFKREERAFFAQKGREIVRVRIEVDMPENADSEDAKSKMREQQRPGAPLRQWSPNQAPPHSRALPSPGEASTGARPDLTPLPFNAHGPSSAPRTIPVTTQPAFGLPATTTPMHSAQPPPPPTLPLPYMGLERHPANPVPSQMEVHPDPIREDPDESWRRPMPHNERRRAGKHTKRVIVK